MLKKILQILNRDRLGRPANPEKFNDSIAQKTSWDPLKKGGASFATHNLVEISSTRLEFKPAIFAVIFYLIFILVGLGMLIFVFNKVHQSGFTIQTDHIFLFIIGSLFFIVGSIVGYHGTKPTVFDRQYGFYWKGRKKPNHDIEYSHPEWFTALNDIHALQILAEYVKSNKNSYYSYELNLIFRDGSRQNVIDHGNLNKIREDAQQISRFINRPVWDVT